MKLEQLAEKIIESSKDIEETVKESREGFKRYKEPQIPKIV